MKEEYKDFEIKDFGFVINFEYLYFGVSFDVIFYCSCYGIGCVEIKCFYKVWDFIIIEVVGFFEKIVNGCL